MENAKQTLTRRIREVIMRKLFAFFAVLSVLLLGLIVLFLFREGIPLFKQISVFQFLFGSAWYPTYDPPEYGIWPLIVDSLIVTLFACLVAVPFGILSAIYISEIAPRFSPASSPFLSEFYPRSTSRKSPRPGSRRS